jgi:hypothetical protein
MAALAADHQQIAEFVEALFAHADDGTFVSLRTFEEEDGKPPVENRGVQINGAGLTPVVQQAVGAANRAARHPSPAVFCPPVATFTNPKKATEGDLANGVALAVEIDANPAGALADLRGLLGTPTAVVASGGEWTDPTTGEVQAKLHVYYRLSEPTRTAEDHARLKAARRYATALVGGDASNVPLVHPIRWPGSVHRKKAPKLARIVELSRGREIDLSDALDVLEETAAARGIAIPATGAAGKVDAGEARTTAELIAGILTADNYHAGLVALAARFAGGGMTRPKIVETLQGIMLSVSAEIRDGDQPGRWQSRYGDIERIVESALGKFGPDADATAHGATVAEELLGGTNPADFDIEQFNAKILVGTAPPIDWLIDGSFRLGELGVLAAMGAAGKSMLLLALALEIIQTKAGNLYRNPLLGGEVVATGSVVLFCAEDNRNEVWRRLEQLDPGGKIRASAAHNLYVVTVPDLGAPVYICRTKGREIALDKGLEFIEGIVSRIPDLKLAAIDPIQPFCGADLNQSAEAVQIVFNALSNLAAKSKAAIILAHHMRKTGAKDITSPEEAREAIRGSGDIVNRPRLSYALWPAGKDDTAKVSRALGLVSKRNAVFLGSVVKANGIANPEVQTYVRGDNGLLVDRTAAVNSDRRANAAGIVDALVRGAAAAAVAGRPFMRTGMAGLHARRSELPEELQHIGKNQIAAMADRLLEEGKLVLAIAGGSSTPRWLDIPGGPFATGDGQFTLGAPSGSSARKGWAEA